MHVGIPIVDTVSGQCMSSAVGQFDFHLSSTASMSYTCHFKQYTIYAIMMWLIEDHLHHPLSSASRPARQNLGLSGINLAKGHGRFIT